MIPNITYRSEIDDQGIVTSKVDDITSKPDTGEEIGAQPIKPRFVIVPEHSDVIIIAEQSTTLHIGSIVIFFDTAADKEHYEQKLNSYFVQCVTKHMLRIGEDCSDVYFKK